ncbi:YifB family Mg chelatase-like AAA ATPase [Motiliproteus sp.]|uniref:YifB family Mg chelatase-like AAA ATPase n=1 Tax=Motiliproteus sp. TaxID=1898955 RepID=UPI003BAB6202
MSLAIVHSRALLGIDAPSVTVEVHLSNGLPGFSIVGLPEAAVKESKERVRSALLNSRFDYPMRRITVNLAPADLPKEGGRYDLAIALGILCASGQLEQQQLDRLEVIGELALSGELRAVPGALPSAMQARRAGRALLLPRACADEAALLPDIDVLGAEHLLQACAHLLGQQPLQAVQAPPLSQSPGGPDLVDVRGQYQARRALEVAAAGGHSLLMSGPPGTGKTMLASRLPSLLPPLTPEEQLEVVSIRSVARQTDTTLNLQRPFRQPHHTVSGVALVGGGSTPRPGEISLANHGVLFLDELPEFDRRVLEVLREPMESGQICISRASAQVTFPARFQLIAAMNPCPCGYQGDPSGRCRCTPDQIKRYQGRISGPLLDRLDLQIEVGALSEQELIEATTPAEDSASVRRRVELARQRQLRRRGKLNHRLSGQELELDCALNRENRQLMQQALNRLGLSARAYHRVLRVARTLADLEGATDIDRSHLLQSLSYRRQDRAMS